MTSAKVMMVSCSSMITERYADVLPTEFAEYTAAQERIALGKKAKKKEVASRRAEMKELINDACVFRCVSLLSYVKNAWS